jgi:hypothetical protein
MLAIATDPFLEDTQVREFQTDIDVLSNCTVFTGVQTIRNFTEPILFLNMILRTALH